MIKGWQTKALGDVCAFENGDRGTNYPSKSARTETGIPFINAGHLTDDGLDFSAMDYISRERFNLLGNGKVRAGDILFCLRGSLGKAASVGDLAEGAIASSLVIVRPRSQVIGPFISAYFKSSFCAGMIELHRNGAAQPNLSAGNLKQFIIPLPPLPEQQRIVRLLDQAFAVLAAAKANADTNRRNARALFDSHLESVFAQRGDGWEEKRLQALTTKIGSGATPLGGEEAYKTEGVSLIRSLNVHDMGFRHHKLAFIDDAQASALSNVIVQSRDVLLNITGASVARCCVVPEDVLPARVNQHVAIIRPIAEKMNAKFLHYLLISKPYKDHLLETGAEGGSTRQAITKAQIEAFVVQYPRELNEQQRIVAQLDALREQTQRLESLYRQKGAALDELKKALLHQAFAGEL